MRSSAASKKNFLHFVKSQNLDLQSSSVKDMFTEFEKHKHVFDSVSTQYKQNDYLVNHGFLIKPLPYVIGTEQVFKMDRASKVIVPDLKEITGQYVPIKAMLQ